MPTSLDDKVDKLEAAVDPNTVISVGGFNFTPAKLMVAGALVSSVLGGLYGAFEVYKDYMSMKEAIQNYVAPDLSELHKKMALLEQNTNKTSEYIRDINVNLKQDIRRVEGVLETVERSVRQSQRDVEVEVREVKRTVDQTVKNVDSTVRSVTQEMNKLERETANELRNIRKEVDDKIKKAIDNPLANQ